MLLWLISLSLFSVAFCIPASEDSYRYKPMKVIQANFQEKYNELSQRLKYGDRCSLTAAALRQKVWDARLEFPPDSIKIGEARGDFVANNEPVCDVTQLLTCSNATMICVCGDSDLAPIEIDPSNYKFIGGECVRAKKGFCFGEYEITEDCETGTKCSSVVDGRKCIKQDFMDYMDDLQMKNNGVTMNDFFREISLGKVCTCQSQISNEIEDQGEFGWSSETPPKRGKRETSIQSLADDFNSFA